MFLCYVVFSLTNKPDFTKSTAAVKQKGKTPPVQEDKPQKSGSSREPEEKEQQPEGIRLRKVPVKAPEPAKQVLTHTAEGMRHHDRDLSAHGLLGREERDTATQRRSELVLDANQEAVWKGSFLEVESVIAVEEVEGEVWTRSPKKEKEDEPKVPDVEKKKVHSQLKEKEQKESVKLKYFKKSEKQNEDLENLENIKLKKVPPKSKEPEKKIVTCRAEVTRQHNSEVVAEKLSLREDGEVEAARKSGHLLPAAQEPSDLSHIEDLHKFQEDNGKNTQIRAPKNSSLEESDKDVTMKGKKLLPQKEGEQEVVKLKPFKKTQRAETEQPTETQKNSETKTGSRPSPFQRSGAPLRDQLSAMVHPKEDQQRLAQRSEPAAAHRPVLSTPDKKKELLTSRPPPTDHQQEDKADAASEHRKPGPTEKTPKDLKDLGPSKETPERKKPGLSEKETAVEKKPENQADTDKKEPKPKMTPSLRVAKGKPEVKPVEQIQKVELKKAPSPKDREQKAKKVETEEKFSTIRLKKSPQRAAQPEEPGEEQLHLVKQVSPGAVQVKKVPTRLEEEVFEEVPEKEEGGEEEEVWGWELLPAEDWTGEGLDGAVETPGPPGSKRGEVTAVQPPHSLDPP